MKKALKQLVLRKNERGSWLWVYPAYAAFHNLRNFPVRRFIKLLNYLTRVWAGKLEPLRLEKNLKTSVFYLGLAGSPPHQTVVKLPRLDNRYAHAFARSIRQQSDFDNYSALLRGLHRDRRIGKHCPPVLTLKRDGGYESPLIAGHNLASLRDLVSKTHSIPSDLDATKLLRAIEELDRSIEKRVNSREPATGDWAFHNLIYETASSTIKNVDLEGFFTYDHQRVEAAHEFVRAELSTLRTLVQLVVEGSPSASKVLGALSAIRDAATSDVSYSGRAYSAGYHSVTIDGHYFRGQRECLTRLAQVPYDFGGKTVLDLGCNTGGMLHCLADQITRGVGLDLDPKCVKAAKLVRDVNKADNLDFHTFNLDRERLDRIKQFVGEKPLDICFLLSVCMWLDKPQEVIDWVSRTSRALLFETNGNELQQKQQMAYVRERYDEVQLISPDSPDDPGQKKRALYLCTQSVRPEE